MSGISLSDLTKLIIGGVFSIGLVALTAMKIVPPEAFCAIVGAGLTFIIEEWSKEREIARITRQLRGE